MNAYELISPKTGKPCGVWVCGVCNLVTPKECVERCCTPCACGKSKAYRWATKCNDCSEAARKERRRKQLEEAELVEWDGDSMIFSEEVQGNRDGWFDSPEDLADYARDELEAPDFAFLGLKCVRLLDIDRAIEAMQEDTYDDCELHVAEEDMAELQAAVDKFNSKYAITYYEYDYRRKVQIK